MNERTQLILGFLIFAGGIFFAGMIGMNQKVNQQPAERPTYQCNTVSNETGKRITCEQVITRVDGSKTTFGQAQAECKQSGKALDFLPDKRTHCVDPKYH